MEKTTPCTAQLINRITVLKHTGHDIRRYIRIHIIHSRM